MKIEQLFTKKKANQGVEIPVRFSEDGETFGTLTIYGCDSDVFKEQMQKREVENARILTLPEKERQSAIEKADLEAIASCISDWSFEDKFTQVNVHRLLTQSPFIFELVNKSVMDRSLFLNLT